MWFGLQVRGKKKASERKSGSGSGSESDEESPRRNKKLVKRKKAMLSGSDSDSGPEVHSNTLLRYVTLRESEVADS